MNYEERDEYVQQKANEYCKKEKERGTLMKIGGVEALVYKAYKNGYYESEKENTVHTLDVLHKEVVRKYGEVNDQLNKAKEIMQKLIDNAPDTYSGTNIELQQKKMFSFQDAVNKAEQFLNNEVEE